MAQNVKLEYAQVHMQFWMKKANVESAMLTSSQIWLEENVVKVVLYWAEEAYFVGQNELLDNCLD